ncbi:DegT/DnrJ/EryC1/StrS family aminotransferase [Sphingomonas nostoxanthinifaciens]|uniref:DegT/DnrJ/EryC1/StrS family aminotransferase n=1 Tax=Sphingomonas nostoxanthinifaciens TaxID=2872652 RepID=UPI001CC1DE2F|nr:DegT/DnrJ/EryC1/StrS family aminotransferase [Sphingomonas nostoxanthinifaciens]UAK24997.1 DegT/DnrJ/EryC1/StrS family aminotransferase [Sphingomonas nostoxanthinifaciens]
MIYPLAASTWDDAELAAIREVIDGGVFTMGRRVAEFERAFADFVGSRYAVMSNSGSSANLLAVAALAFRKEGAIDRGDEVIVPAVSWSTTFYPLAQYGLRLKFIDIDPHTLNYDLGALEEAITDRTRVIQIVNLLGNPNDFAAIERIVGDRDIVLIEDNCESMGATFAGRQAGTFGLAGTFSCFFSHHISTMEGGLTVTDDEEMYQLMVSLRAHGWTRHLPKSNLVTETLSDNPFYETFNFVLPGYNLRPLEMSGAIGLRQLEKLPGLVAQRRANAAHFQAAFANHPLVSIQQEVGESSWFGFAMVVRPGARSSRDDLVAALSRAGVECRPVVAGNFTRNSVIRHLDHEIFGALPHADLIHDNGLFIGNHHFDVRESLGRVREICDQLA